MLIFVDESGSFTMPQAGKRNLSCVGALIVPETVHNDLISDFVNLRNTWGESQQEVKGHGLNEEQTAEKNCFLINHSCAFYVCATEMSLNTDSMIANFQRTQAEYITENVSDSAHPLLRRQVLRLRRTYEKMPAQLFLPSVQTGRAHG